jgi:hypothetical protein
MLNTNPPPPPPPPPRSKRPPKKHTNDEEDGLSGSSQYTRQSIPNQQYQIMQDHPSSQKRNKNKSKYVAKEQRIRANQLETEKKMSSYLGTLPYGLHKNNYSLSIQMTKTDASEATFHEGDWTPLDSSYGGAFPFCGWMPKRIRQAIEHFLLVIAAFTMVYFLINAAIKLTGSRSSSSSSSSSSYEFDDDHYIEAGYDDAEYVAYTTYYDDDDDAYNNDDYG